MSALLENLAPEAFEPRGDGFAEQRRLARTRLMQHGFPGLKTEAWKYTPLRLLEKRALEEVPPPTGEAPEYPFEATVLHFDQGRLDPGACRLPAGLRLERLRPEDNPDPDYGDRAGAFGWLNLERFEQGWKLVVEGRLDTPVVLAVTTSQDFAGAVHPRLMLELAAGARACLIESHHDRGAGLVNSVFDLRLNRGASLRHIVDRAGADSALIQRTSVDLAADADYRLCGLDRGGRLSRTDLNVHLNEPGAQAGIDAVMLIDSRQHVDYHTNIEHRVGATHSREDFRALAGGTGTGVFNGRIYIARNADDSHSALNTANLLLSDRARINTKPELEIYAEEVTASHGATVGQLDADALFYLRSRGLDETAAAALLKYGFAAAPLAGVEPEAVGAWLNQHLREAL